MSNNQPFAILIEEARTLLAQLDEILLQERESIKERTPSDLEQLLKNKKLLLEALEHNNIERSKVLTAAGFEVSESGAQSYFKQQSSSDSIKLSEAWDVLKTSLEKCKNANLVNGKIINRSRQQVDLLLDIMRGQSNSPRLYTQAGSSSAISRQQPLAKA